MCIYIIQLLVMGRGCVRYYIAVMKVYLSDWVQKMEQHNKVSQIFTPLTRAKFLEKLLPLLHVCSVRLSIDD